MTLEMSDDWLRLRAQTPGAEKAAYFNNAGAALMPKPVIEAVKAHLDLEAEIGGYEAARDQAAAIDEVYCSVGAVIGAPPENIALTANATDAYARALSSIPFEKGDVILAAWSEYASNQIQLISLARRLGLEILRAPQRAAGGADLDALDALIKLRKPRLVVAVHMNTSSGFIEDVAGIGALCRRHDTLYLVDGCQSLGQMPIDVGAIGCDFFSATSRKFIRGPRGAGVLYVSDHALEMGLEPLFLDLRGAVLLNETEYQPVESVRRFEDWEFSYAVLLGFGAAGRYALDIGLDRIERRLGELNRHIRGRIADLDGWRVIDQGEPLGPIIPVHATSGDGEHLHNVLLKAGVNTNYTPHAWAPMDDDLREAGWAIRVSPHYYNSPADIDRLVFALEEVL